MSDVSYPILAELGAEPIEAKGDPYEAQFVDRLKTALPDWSELHQALDQGDLNVGYLLHLYAGRLLAGEDSEQAERIIELHKAWMRQLNRWVTAGLMK
ncbi:hypothetical protein ACFL04_00840 [Patescibacteria group bacterium]